MADPAGDGGVEGFGPPTDTILGISFDNAFRAQEFLTAAYRLVSQHNIELLDAVIIAKDASGRTRVQETTDPGPAQSALSAGIWTGFLGLILLGPIGWLAGTAVGAGAGAVRAKVRDVGVPDEWVGWFRDAVQPSTFTVVLLIGEYNRTVVDAELERFAGGRLVYANLDHHAVQRIRDALKDPSTGPLTQADTPGEQLDPPTGEPFAPPTAEERGTQ